ncbi:arsenate reductase [Aliishimia ponticola]|uniref:Arsenate reductase n=1 Tax=Aliishimia ponticola TaxID=2499833 RepID=A0A4S4NAS7_9RHOB|nr:ArsC/Spx/MgsR family protein [Aliishimia ponticola]THH35775.1 arsenate reductase [Aliishimia ponticola]
MQIFGLKTCDTCRKARKALPEAEFVDVREVPLPDAVLASALDRFGTDLVNTRSTTWRGMSDEDRAMAPDAQLRAFPALMKRPLIQAGDQMYLGWTKDVQAALVL